MNAKPKIAYTVIATISDPDKAKEWLHWLENGHIEDVIKGGAASATIIKLDNENGTNCSPAAPVSPPAIHTKSLVASTPVTYEIRYLFDNRGIFEKYLELHAPRLRTEGLKLFPPEDGFAYQRTVGEIIG